jgi:hypothetical protein
MIDTLLGKVAGLFEKDFLFASFLPCLIFMSCTVATLTAVIGVDGVCEWMEAWNAVQKSAATLFATLVIVIFAYVLHAMRPALTKFWSGRADLVVLWGFRKLGELIEAYRYRLMEERSKRFSPWQDVLDQFTSDVEKVWDANRPEPSPNNIKDLLKLANGLQEGMGAAVVKERVGEVVKAFSLYSGEKLSVIYEPINRSIMEWNEREEVQIQTDTCALDRHFGTLETIRATALGNIIESYNQYAYKRYRMEAEIFWPRLRRVIPAEYFELVREPRILLDFSLAMATLGAAYALLALLAGPWLWYKPSFWLPLAAAGLLVSYFFYRLGVGAAQQLGEMIRSSFDLFRLDLMTALSRPHPATFLAEQKQWEELSRVAVYGTAPDFQILEREVPRQ